MKHFTRARSAGAQTSGGPRTPAKRRVKKRSTEPARNSKKVLPSDAKAGRLVTRKSDRVSRIRETEEARALLADQLHGLYWWVFNACKMKGFIRAKALDELHRDAANGSEDGR